MAKTFLFDLAGVLINWETTPLYLEIFDRDHDQVHHFFTEILTQHHLSEISTGRAARAVLDELKTTHPGYSVALDAWVDDWDRMVTGPIEGTLAITRELREHGLCTYILGNWSRDEFARACARFAFLDEFHGVVISGDHGVMKPSPQIFQIALDTFDLTAADTMFIDDSAGNVEAAAQLGFDAIHFTDPPSLREILTKRGILKT